MNQEEKYKKVLEEYSNSDISIKELCKKYHVSDRVIYKAIKNGEIEKRCIDHIYDILIKDKELFYYLLGLVASDGYLYDQKNRIEIGLQLSDSKLLEDISYRIYKENRTYIEEKRNRVRILLQTKNTYALFKSYGLFQKKSKDLNMDLNKIPKEYFHHFFRGYMDGDGSYWVHNPSNINMRIVGNKYMAYSFQECIQRYYGIKSYVYKVKTPANFQMYAWSLQNTPDVKRLINSIYYNANIYLERKYNTIQEFLSAV